MSKLETTKRYHLIINKLRTAKGASFAEIAAYLRRESEIDGLNYNISLRTFQRDIQEIGSIFGIYIKFDFSGKYYFIEEEFEPEMSERFFEAFDLFSILKTKDNLSKFVSFDSRKQGGTEHIYGLLHAIRNRFLVSFSYQKFYSDHVSERTVKPLALKESKYRWYLFARDTYDDRIKTYALDRFTGLQITNTHFEQDSDFNIVEYLRYCFGVIVPRDETPQEIILSFVPFQGKYIKTLPLHSSQKILIDNDDELQISLQLYPTHDFIMELLSLGDTVKVIEPQDLAKNIKDIHRQAAKKY